MGTSRGLRLSHGQSSDLKQGNRRSRGLRLSLKQKRNVVGFLFTLPVLLGFILFSLYPLIQSITFSLSKLEISRTGYALRFVGLENYRHVLLVNASFTQTLVATILRVVSDVPLILVFSLIAALLLNQKFAGRTLARIVFFLPVIYGAGIVFRMESADYMTMLQSGQGAGAEGAVSMGTALRNYLWQMRLPQGFLEYIMAAIGRLPQIVKASGIQILIFLAGLQSVPANLYEAAKVEGATQWETFWMITFPLLSPLLVTNTVYTIIDSFTSPYNSLRALIEDTAFSGGGYGISTAMSWIYFLFIGAVLLIATKLMSRRVFHY
jgi:ABC-type sugar transport system permease subunit